MFIENISSAWTGARGSTNVYITLSLPPVLHTSAQTRQLSVTLDVCSILHDSSLECVMFIEHISSAWRGAGGLHTQHCNCHLCCTHLHKPNSCQQQLLQFESYLITAHHVIMMQYIGTCALGSSYNILTIHS